MFSVIYVCSSVSHSAQGEMRSHRTIAHDALDLTVQPPPPQSTHETWDSRPRTPDNDIWWSSLETRSDLFVGAHCTTPCHPDIWWFLLKHIQFANGWYGSYWKALLLFKFLFCGPRRNEAKCK